MSKRTAKEAGKVIGCFHVLRGVALLKDIEEDAAISIESLCFHVLRGVALLKG